MPLDPDFVQELRKHFTGDIRNDLASRILYSTDGSIYQVEPLGVVIPRTQEDLHAAVELAARHHVPILPRGSGSSLAGQAIGQAMIVDCSRWLDKIVDVDAENHVATVEPGVILSHLNQAAGKLGLQYGPDPASAERATMGGVIANNATGAHSIRYGMTADHIVAAEVILSDGSLATLDACEPQPAPSSGSPLYSALIDAAMEIREDHAEAIKAHYPRSWRNSAGYRLNYLLPWSATRPPQWDEADYPRAGHDGPNLAALLAGSEGTLAVIRRATVNLVPKPQHSVLGILRYESIPAACEAVPGLLERHPSAVELIPRMLIHLARGVPGYASQMSWVRGDPAAVLAVEFSGGQPESLLEQVRALGVDVVIADSAETQAQVWNVRRVGLGILDSRPQSRRPVAFVEDCAIPVERLADFVREIERILAEHHTEAGIYAHASAGTLHVRPVLDLKTGEGVHALRDIAEQMLALTLRLGGAMASEHGDGLARAEWLRQTYGDELSAAMRKLKQAADPDGLLNPGKLFDAPPMDQNLRYGAAYKARLWKPGVDFSENGGLDIAIEQCNGQGVCRKDTGVMCPSFQGTREEMHSTRGRANLLRALITSGTSIDSMRRWDAEHERAAFEALDLCLACKGCKAECPSGVDMAKLKFAFEAEYYKHHARRLRDYAFGYFPTTAVILSALGPLVNAATSVPMLWNPAARIFGIAPQRPFPKFAAKGARARKLEGGKPVLFLRDPFTHYAEPQAEQAAFHVLYRAGFNVRLLPGFAAGASLTSKGLLGGARAHVLKRLESLRRMDPEARIPIVGLEPSEIYALRNEYANLIPERRSEMERYAENSWYLDEFLVRQVDLASLRIAIELPQILFHPHCHQSAEGPLADGLPNGTDATVAVLCALGYEVQRTDAGCCGMAGTFGYEAEHYQLSEDIGALKLFPLIQANPGSLIAASGASCRMQIKQGTGAEAVHPIELVQRAMEA